MSQCGKHHLTSSMCGEGDIINVAGGGGAIIYILNKMCFILGCEYDCERKRFQNNK